MMSSNGHRAIVGIGTDIVELDRIRAILNSRNSGRFLQRILTDAEFAQSKNKQRRLAEHAGGRFAAKEAVAKALGSGIGGKVGFHDIEILPDKKGKPICTLSAEAAQRLQLPPKVNVHISISHTAHYATAFAIVEV